MPTNAYFHVYYIGSEPSVFLFLLRHLAVLVAVLNPPAHACSACEVDTEAVVHLVLESLELTAQL